VVWSFQYEAFGNNIVRLTFHEKSEMVGDLGQLNFDSFKFPEVRIYTRSILIT
jgi:hypothetical protein